MRTNERTNERTNVSAHLHAALADLRTRRDKLDAAIGGLEDLLGLAPGAPTGNGSVPASPGPAKGRRRRVDAELDETGEAILACLRQHGALSPADLQKHAKISAYLLTSRLKVLGSRVVVTGSTNDRIIALPGQVPKEHL